MHYGVDYTPLIEHDRLCFFSFKFMLIHVHTAMTTRQKTSECHSSIFRQILGHMSHFHLGTVDAEFRGRCRRQRC